MLQFMQSVFLISVIALVSVSVKLHPAYLILFAIVANTIWNMTREPGKIDAIPYVKIPLSSANPKSGGKE